MEWEEAKAEVKRTGGTISWSKEKNWFVEPQYKGKAVPWYHKAMPFAWPWQTETGEGFALPWSQGYLTPQGRLAQYQYGKPQISWAGQQELPSGYVLPTWMGRAEPTMAQLKGLEAAPEGEVPDWLAAYNATRALNGFPPLTEEEYRAEIEAMKLPKLTHEQALAIAKQLGLDASSLTYNEKTGGFEISEPPYQRTYEPYGQSPYGEGGQFNPYTGQWEQPAGYVSPFQKEQFEWEQQQWQQQLEMQQQQLEMQQQQHLAQLAANPMSWLQYAAEAGQQAAIQPWMMPLMSQQYPSLQAGQPIPGFKGTEGMTGMPELTRPSAQYQARLGPTALQQYYGYQQAQQGARPEETQFRRWNEAPPGGSWPGLQYRR